MTNLSLYYFIAVAEDLNISHTAKRLFMTQQALSEQIRKLEKQYNSVFFERKPRFKLTYKGEQMLSYAKQVVKAEQNLVEKLSSDDAEDRVRLSIGGMGAKSNIYILQLIKNYHLRHPNVILTVDNGGHESVINKFNLGLLDLLIGTYMKYSGEFSSERLVRDYLYFIINKTFLEKVLGNKAEAFIEDHKFGLSIADAGIFPVAMPPNNSLIRTAMEVAYRNNGIYPNVVFETTSNDQMFDICNMDFCGSYVSRELLYNRLVTNRFPEGMIYFPSIGMGQLTYFGISYRKNPESVYVSDLINCSRDVIRNMSEEMDEYLLRRII